MIKLQNGLERKKIVYFPFLCEIVLVEVYSILISSKTSIMTCNSCYF